MLYRTLLCNYCWLLGTNPIQPADLLVLRGGRQHGAGTPTQNCLTYHENLSLSDSNMWPPAWCYSTILLSVWHLGQAAALLYYCVVPWPRHCDRLYSVKVLYYCLVPWPRCWNCLYSVIVLYYCVVPWPRRCDRLYSVIVLYYCLAPWPRRCDYDLQFQNNGFKTHDRLCAFLICYKVLYC